MTEPRDQWQTIEMILWQAIDELVTKLEWQTSGKAAHTALVKNKAYIDLKLLPQLQIYLSLCDSIKLIFSIPL